MLNKYASHIRLGVILILYLLISVSRDFNINAGLIIMLNIIYTGIGLLVIRDWIKGLKSSVNAEIQAANHFKYFAILVILISFLITVLAVFLQK